MSNIDLSQLIGLPLLDTTLVEPSLGNTRPGTGESFNDYLQRVQNYSTDSGNSGTGGSAGNSGQSSAQPTDKSYSSTASPRENSQDDVNNTDRSESAKKDDYSASERRQASNDNPVKQGKPVAQTNKDEADNEKDKRDDSDSPSADTNPDYRLNPQINAQAANVKNHSPSEDDASAMQVKLGDASNSLHVASKEAKTKTTVGSEASNKAESLTANTSQTTVAEEKTSISASIKGKTSKNSALEEEKIAGESSAAQANESASTSKKGKTSAAKTSKDNSTQSRYAQEKTARQGENNEPSAAGIAETTVSSAVSQNAPAGAAAVNSAALQAAVNAPFTPTKQAEDKIDALTANASSNDKSTNSVNASPRLDQTAAKTTAAATQGNGDETGSQVDSTRFVQRVERAFAAMSESGGTLRLKLSPPELGSVHMEITVSKGVMKARLEAETKEAKNLLLENLPALRDRLAQQNIKIQKFDVDLRDPSSGGMSQQTTDQAESGSSGGGYRPPQPQTKESGAATEITSAGSAFVADHSGQLNVVV
ncbi:MAG: flagellar hook-length control protein FliK [Thermoguttaceae bacterium]|jgi:flagellar hook-length control protein FliK